MASRLRFTVNAFVTINQLPPEVLGEVFLHLRPAVRKGPGQPRSTFPSFKGLFAVTHVCRYWRSTAIASPELWSQLNIRPSNKNLDDLIQLLIRRSGGLPLDADLGCRLAAVVPYVHRLRTLFCAGSSAQDFSELCNPPAPLLEKLHILLRPGSSSREALPTLFNGDTPSLHKLDVNGFDPLPNNRFRGLSSFRLQLSSAGGNPTFDWYTLLTALQNSPQLKELFLYLNFDYDHFPSMKGIRTPVPLHALQRLHVRNLTSTIVRQFLNIIDLPPDGTAMKFTNIIPHFDWICPPTLPLDLSFHAVTSLEITFPLDFGFIIQGHNRRTQIRVAETLDSDAMHTEIFSYLIPRADSQLPLRELWIHVGRGIEYTLPLSKFPRLEKLVVKSATTREDTVHHLLKELESKGARLPCPLLSTLDLSGRLNVEVLAGVLRTRSEGWCKLQRLRLRQGHIRGLTEAIERSEVRNYVGKLELFDLHTGPYAMEFPAVCTTGRGELWQPWTYHQV